MMLKGAMPRVIDNVETDRINPEITSEQVKIVHFERRSG